MKVSVLLLAHNEAANIPRCLDALGFCDDIVLIDSGSTDGTLDIARARNVRILHRPFDNFAGQRNHGLAHGKFRHDWVLHLDADEVVTPTFVAKLASLEPEEGIDAYFVPSKTMMFDRWLKHAGMYPAYQVRLGRVGGLTFRQVGHGQREALPPERIAVFDEPYLHYAFSHGLKSWFTKHLRYADEETDALIAIRQSSRLEVSGLLSTDRVERRRSAKILSGYAPPFSRPFLRFAYIYFGRRGFLDGGPGFLYAFMLAVYEGMFAVLLTEKLRKLPAAATQPGSVKTNTKTEVT